MATKNVKAVIPETGSKTADEWAIKKKVPGMYLSGMLQREKWTGNKMLEEREFDAALRNFLQAAADGRKK